MVRLRSACYPERGFVERQLEVELRDIRPVRKEVRLNWHGTPSGSRAIKEVSKEKFKETYFKLGGGQAAGHGLEYWNKFYENNEKGMKYLVREPETAQHTRMMIVTDYACKEYRMFFLTEKEEEDFLILEQHGLEKIGSTAGLPSRRG
jgi:hypothetical protein